MQKKTWLRNKALEARGALNPEYREKSARFLAECVEALDLGPNRTVSGFWPIRGEIDPRPLMEAIRARGHRIALPVVNDPVIEFREYRLGPPLADAGFGTMGPGPDAPAIRPDAMLVPLAAFDRSGGRIGYGKGYYDAAIADFQESGPLSCIGLAFCVQEVDSVPMEAHDRRLPRILTERGLILCGKG